MHSSTSLKLAADTNVAVAEVAMAAAVMRVRGACTCLHVRVGCPMDAKPRQSSPAIRKALDLKPP